MHSQFPFILVSKQTNCLSYRSCITESVIQTPYTDSPSSIVKISSGLFLLDLGALLSFVTSRNELLIGALIKQTVFVA